MNEILHNRLLGSVAPETACDPNLPHPDDLRPVAFSFGQCAGWLHPSESDHGVIVCGTVGQEALAVHLGIRHLCCLLARSGMNAVRFDYPGTGDSAGAEDDLERLEHWVASVVTAADWLRGQRGVERISLVGLRIGGAIAALAASLVQSDRLVLLNPVVSGRSYLREIRLLASTWSAKAGDRPIREVTDGCLDVIGYRWDAASLRSLSELDLHTIRSWPPQVTIMDAGVRRETSTLAAALRAQDIDVQLMDFPGASAFFQDALHSVVPEAAFDLLCAAMASPFKRPAHRPRGINAAIVLDGAKEMPLTFGPQEKLFGMLCEPDVAAAKRGAPAVLMLNTGFTPHVGHARVNVLLARALAKVGITSLRMDGAGIGDSDVPLGQEGRLLHDLRGGVDIKAAIDALEGIGYQRVIVLGLCTGGYQGFHTARVEPRITEVIAVNTQKFVWTGGPSFNVTYDGNRRSTGIYLLAALQRHSWKRVRDGEVDLTRLGVDLFRRTLRSWRHSVMLRLEDVTGRSFQAGRLRRWIESLTDRDVRVRLIYGEADPGLADLHFQIPVRRMTRKNPRFTVDILAQSDNTLSRIAARDAFIDLVVKHCAGEHRLSA